MYNLKVNEVTDSRNHTINLLVSP